MRDVVKIYLSLLLFLVIAFIFFSNSGVTGFATKTTVSYWDVIYNVKDNYNNFLPGANIILYRENLKYKTATIGSNGQATFSSLPKTYKCNPVCVYKRWICWKTVYEQCDYNYHAEISKTDFVTLTTNPYPLTTNPSVFEVTLQNEIIIDEPVHISYWDIVYNVFDDSNNPVSNANIILYREGLVYRNIETGIDGKATFFSMPVNYDCGGESCVYNYNAKISKIGLVDHITPSYQITSNPITFRINLQSEAPLCNPLSCGTISCTFPNTQGSCSNYCDPTDSFCVPCIPECSCSSGYLDCDEDMSNGCEVYGSCVIPQYCFPSTCGTTSCTLPNTQGSCSNYCDPTNTFCVLCNPTCSCSAGYLDCDGTMLNGCEYHGSACPIQPPSCFTGTPNSNGYIGMSVPSCLEIFNSNSPWKTKISSNPSIDSNSNTMISHLSSGLSPNYRTWTAPIHLIDSSKAPLKNVQSSADCFIPSIDTLNGPSNNVVENVPMPSELWSDPSTDGHMVVIDVATNYVWEFSRAVKDSSGNWKASVVDRWDLSGEGWRAPQTGSCWWRSGVDGAGTTYITGLIRIEEIQAGVINHALSISTPVNRNDYLCSPVASRTDGSNNGVGYFMEGQRIQLNPNYDISGLTPKARVIAKALQDYGGYIMDNSGNFNVYLQNLGYDNSPWGTYLNDLSNIRNIPLSQFRVLDCAGNGGSVVYKP